MKSRNNFFKLRKKPANFFQGNFMKHFLMPGIRVEQKYAIIQICSFCFTLKSI